jgi:hypothetical protein
LNEKTINLTSGIGKKTPQNRLEERTLKKWALKNKDNITFVSIVGAAMTLFGLTMFSGLVTR